MRILMLGNSFTYYHDMPVMLAHMTGAEVVAHTRGGASLAEHLNPDTELGAKTLPALRNETWDYVILQEQSNAPALHRAAFQRSAAELCQLIRAYGAVPVFYATWAYREGSEKLATVPYTYAEMEEALTDSYLHAAEANGALIAHVGRAFTALRGVANMYEEDDYHPSEAGSMLAAATLAAVINAHAKEA